MLYFEPYSLSALQKVLPYLQVNPSLCCDLSAGYLFMWQQGADLRFCVWNDTLVVRQSIGEQPAFSYPIGAHPGEMLDELIAYVNQTHLPLRFFAVDEPTLEKIRSDQRLQPAMWAYERRWSDYIYSFEEAMDFRGKKYNGQRNHINKFKRLYGEPEIRFLESSDRAAVEALLHAFAAEHKDAHALERRELEQSMRLFDVRESLECCAAGLFVDQTLAAFSIGEIVGSSLLIHVEKALTRYEGVYPTMYSGFVNLIAKKLGRPLAFVNREDDSGDPGLRISKTQYHPLCLAHKHLVHAGSPACKREPGLVLSRNGIVLTELREYDKALYLRLNTDVQNNRWWGYDYREDLYLSRPVDENSFFDSVQYDMQAGDSINFAIRLRKDGALLGEAILWNFTADGSVEVGCRVFPEYQGRGIGKAAFGAAARYAADFLKLNVTARCHKCNDASYGMIRANGFQQLREDDTFFYFQL